MQAHGEHGSTLRIYSAGTQPQTVQRAVALMAAASLGERVAMLGR